MLISDIVYQPFGAPKAWTWGSGTPYERQFDSDGRMSQYPVGGETRSLGFDDAGRIVNLSHTNPVFNRSYDYDAVDRLTLEVDNIGVSLWAYDLNGNRLSSSTYAYAYPATSNRLTSVAGPVAKTYTYDAAGNTTSDGLYTYTYNAAGRLSQVVRKGKTNTYQHNALGQRIIKSGAYLTNGPYAFLFDEAGHLVGEYDASNALKQETVWLGDTPVAVIKKDASGQIQAYYVHADHLDTPRAIVDSQGRMVWRWLGSAFGQNLPEEDPDGDGTLFEYNLRFPGQYWDKETGLHYNYFRSTYDAMTGRYGESDPIGLEGGTNVYTYVGGNPLRWADRRGLAIDTIWDVLVICYDIATGDWDALPVDAAAAAAPFVPAGIGHLRKVVPKPKVGGGAKLGNVPDEAKRRIQNAVDCNCVKVTVIGSRASGASNPMSDWDYLIEGGNSRARGKAKRALPRGLAGGEILPSGRESGIDVLDGPLDSTLPHMIFEPLEGCGCK